VTALEAVILLNSTGVLAGGFGVLKWALAVERRLIKIEVKTGVLA
jgi:hypothetical protein